jgi:hypothetical protein
MEPADGLDCRNHTRRRCNDTDTELIRPQS